MYQSQQKLQEKSNIWNVKGTKQVIEESKRRGDEERARL